MKLAYFHGATGVSNRPVISVDVCCYGQSPAAITAAIEARRRGRSVVLAVNAASLGGMTTGGLSNTDIGNERVIGGLAREFYRRVGAYYGVAEEWRFEPHVAEIALARMLRESGITPLFAVYPTRVTSVDRRLNELHCVGGQVIRAQVFVDASYEGDLLALAGVPHAIGRESNTTYGEAHNGVQLNATHQFEARVDPFIEAGRPSSGLLRGISAEAAGPIGSGDRRVQAYNFRLCLSRAADRLPFPKPDGYDPRDYELLARYLATGWAAVFHKFDRIRGGKADMNNHGAVSTDFIGGSHGFPEADWAGREAIFQAHVRWQQGLLWFLCHDPRVPAAIQQELHTWGLAADEFTATAGWPPQLYIRESRRMVSDYVVTEHDCFGRRSADDPVALGAYGMDSHNCQRVVVEGAVRNEGDVQVSGFAPYPISYRALVPARGGVSNLIVPVCLSASHTAYGSIRVEPVFMMLGQSAAIAADLALRDTCAVQDVPYARLRAELERAGQVLDARSDAFKDAAYAPEAPAPAMPQSSR